MLFIGNRPVQISCSSASLAIRSKVLCNKLFSPFREENCLGRLLQLSGHRQAPLTPQRMIGSILGLSFCVIALIEIPKCWYTLLQDFVLLANPVVVWPSQLLRSKPQYHLHVSGQFYRVPLFERQSQRL